MVTELPNSPLFEEAPFLALPPRTLPLPLNNLPPLLAYFKVNLGLNLKIDLIICCPSFKLICVRSEKFKFLATLNRLLHLNVFESVTFHYLDILICRSGIQLPFGTLTLVKVFEVRPQSPDLCFESHRFAPKIADQRFFWIHHFCIAKFVFSSKFLDHTLHSLVPSTQRSHTHPLLLYLSLNPPSYTSPPSITCYTDTTHFHPISSLDPSSFPSSLKPPLSPNPIT